MRLSDLYDADYRTKHPEAAALAAKKAIPHPLNNVQYADGISSCRHAKKHQRFELCQQEVRPDTPSSARSRIPADALFNPYGAIARGYR